MLFDSFVNVYHMFALPLTIWSFLLQSSHPYQYSLYHSFTILMIFDFVLWPFWSEQGDLCDHQIGTIHQQVVEFFMDTEVMVMFPLFPDFFLFYFIEDSFTRMGMCLKFIQESQLFATIIMLCRWQRKPRVTETLSECIC